MIHLLRATLRDDRLRTSVLMAGVVLLVSAVTVLGATASTEQVLIKGTVSRTFRPAYDLLVRPDADVTGFERRSHLVRDNYLGNLFGGISKGQLAKIAKIPGIEIAPVENVGYVLVQRTILVPFHPPLTGPAEQLFRIKAGFWLSGRSVSWGDTYIYVTRNDRMQSPTPAVVDERLPRRPRALAVCGQQSFPRDELNLESSPFTMGRLDGYITCFSERTPTGGSFPEGRIEVPVTFDFPMLLSAIDPQVESAWFGLARAIVSGRYLHENESAHLADSSNLGEVLDVPVLASSSTDLAERLTLSTWRVATSPQDGLALALARPNATGFAAKLRGRRVTREVETAATVYASLIRDLTHLPSDIAQLPVPEFWTVSAPRDRTVGDDEVAVAPVANGAEAWRSAPGWGNTTAINGKVPISYAPAPPGNGRNGYGRVTVHYLRAPTFSGQPSGSGAGAFGEPPVANLEVVGTFDPRRLEGFSALSKVPLETFAAPIESAANAASAHAIGDKTLQPTSDLAGYVAQPPLLLTTLAAARAMVTSNRYVTVAGSVAGSRAPISAVLVRVTDNDGDAGARVPSKAQLEAAAQAIREATGLHVDITDGSSPTPVVVHLSHGIILVGHWSKLGVAYSVVSMADVTTLTLLVMTTITGLLFVGTATTAIVRRKRKEFVLLSMVGWQRRELVRAMGATIGMIAVVSTVAGEVTALVFGSVAGSHPRPLLLLAVLVATPVASVLTSIPVIWSDTRGEATSALASSGRSGGRAASRLGVAWALVRAAPWRASVAAVALGISTAAVGAVAGIERQLSEHLDATRTILGTTIAIQLRGIDLLGIGVALALGIAAVLSISLTGASERRTAHAVLTACGWSAGDLAMTTAVEAATIAGLGAAGGLLLGLVSEVIVGLPFSLAWAVFAGATSLAVVVVAVGLPVMIGIDGAPASALAERAG